MQDDGTTGPHVKNTAPMPAASPYMLLPGSLLAGRYQVETALGQGGMGVVYRALDQQKNRQVAIKTFFAPPGIGEGQRRFQREFRALTRLQHPHVVKVFDYGESEGWPFYVMEFIAGMDLAGVRRAHGGRLATRDVITLGLQLCGALAYIHSQGIIHRDLKPSNVMVEGDVTAQNSDFSIKLVDFGLVKMGDVSVELTQSGLLLGTVNYMSPEQAQTLPIDARSDLYSLGVLLYELATGRLPFAGNTAIAVILQHINQPPPPLRSIEASVPPAFESLVLSLLAKRPAERLPSAEAVVSALAGLTSLAAPTPVEVIAAPRADAVFRAELIGRQVELECLNQWLEQAWAGAGRFILIEGEAGVGKTRLAAELGGQVRLGRGVRLVGTCHEAERVPYGPVAEWLEDAFTHKEDFAAIVSGLEAELARLVPHLVPFGSTIVGGDLDPQQAKLRFFDAMMRFLVRLSERRPVMLLLDDVQWADKAMLELLHYVVRNARDQRIFICATARLEGRDESGALVALLRDLSRLHLVERLRLERLSSQSAGELVAALLGLGQAPQELAERIYAESEGNPFFIEEMLKALAEEGLLVRKDGRWHLQAEIGLTMLRIPATIVDVVSRRLARLADADRSVLNWAAVLGQEFNYQILYASSGVQEDALLDALDNLLRDQLIAEVRDPRQDRYHFTHGKIQEVVYADLSSVRRKKMHRSAGQAIERIYAARLEELSPILARHFIQGGDAPKAIEYAVFAGHRARKVYANQEAVGFYQQAIELTGEDMSLANAELLISAHRGLGEVYYLIGEYEQAAVSFQAVIDLIVQRDRVDLEQRRQMAAAWQSYGDTFEKRGVYEEALRCYHEGLSVVDASDSEQHARLLNAVAAVNIQQGDYEQARDQCERAIQLAQDVPDIVATAYGYLGDAARYQNDYDEAITYYEKSLLLWEAKGDRAHVARVLNSLGNLAEVKEAYEEAVTYYEKGLTICQEIGLSLGTASLLNNLGVICQNRGDLNVARDHFQQSLEIYHRIGSKDGVATTYINLAENCIARSEGEQAASFLHRAELIYEEMGDRYGLSYIWILAAEVSLLQDCTDEAQDYAWRALQVAGESGMKLQAGKAHRLLGEIYLQGGQIEEARVHLTRACEFFEVTGKQADLKCTRDLFREIDNPRK